MLFLGPCESIEMCALMSPIRSCTQIDLSFCMCREINCWRAKNTRNSFSNLLFQIFLRCARCRLLLKRMIRLYMPCPSFQCVFLELRFGITGDWSLESSTTLTIKPQVKHRSALRWSDSVTQHNITEWCCAISPACIGSPSFPVSPVLLISTVKAWFWSFFWENSQKYI